MTKKNLNWLWLRVGIIILDQVTKIMIVAQMSLNQSIYINRFFNIVHARNYGAAFSFLDIQGGNQRWLLTFISIAVSLLLIIWLLRTPTTKKLQSLSLAFIIGGALGNFWDRLLQGYVVDFLQVHYSQWAFPAFNIADSAVTIGAILLIIRMVFGKQ